jgi:hypothetical protein
MIDQKILTERLLDSILQIMFSHQLIHHGHVFQPQIIFGLGESKEEFGQGMETP